MSDFGSYLSAGTASLGIEISAASLDRLTLYFTELKKWSARINLIGRSASDKQIVETHFLDSLTLLEQLRGEKNCHLLDIGTGAGFPGLVCKAALPDLSVTLVEPRLKRVSFLQHIVRSLGLTGVQILSCRIEDEARLSSQTGFSHITGRAVTEVGPFLQMVERFAQPGCRLVLMKGPKWQEELEAASKSLALSSYTLKRVVECQLPFTGARRSLLLFSVEP